MGRIHFLLKGGGWVRIIENRNKNKVARINTLEEISYKDAFLIGVFNDGYCLCANKKDESTKCMCEQFRESTTLGFCNCRLYEKVEL